MKTEILEGEFKADKRTTLSLVNDQKIRTTFWYYDKVKSITWTLLDASKNETDKFFNNTDRNVFDLNVMHDNLESGKEYRL